MKTYYLNIYGSTGTIGVKTLKLVEKNFSNIKVNLLVANNNYKLLIRQFIKFNPKYVFINNPNLIKKLEKKIHKNKIIFDYDQLLNYLSNSKSDLTIFAISGYKSLYYLESVISNTKSLGIVNKESIVSAGHILKKKNIFKKYNLFPIDSEHYSLFEFLKFSNFNNIDLKKIILTASGGPFYKYKFKNLDNISFKQAINHPKWKMGYKNSIDSATMVNKCLEVIEAHYLFDIPYEKIDVLIHPEAIIHSIVEKENNVTHFNLFKNDMSIPIYNFLNQNIKNKKRINSLSYNSYSEFSFINIKFENFPIYKFFLNMDKNDPNLIIKFNIGNEFAFNLFKQNLIKYTDIYRIIKKVCALNLYSSLNSIKDIIEYHENVENKIRADFKNFF